MVEDPERLTDDSSRTVTSDRISDLLSGHYATAVATAVGLSEIADKAVARTAGALFIKVSEFAVILDLWSSGAGLGER